MLTFSNQQMADIQSRRNERVYQRLAQALRDMYPGGEVSQAQVVEEIRPIAREAMDRGVSDGELLAQHVYASKVFGKGYWERVPSVGAVLWDADLEEGLRLAWLTGWMDSMQVELKKRGR